MNAIIFLASPALYCAALFFKRTISGSNGSMSNKILILDVLDGHLGPYECYHLSSKSSPLLCSSVFQTDHARVMYLLCIIYN